MLTYYHKSTRITLSAYISIFEPLTIPVVVDINSLLWSGPQIQSEIGWLLPQQFGHCCTSRQTLIASWYRSIQCSKLRKTTADFSLPAAYIETSLIWKASQHGGSLQAILSIVSFCSVTKVWCL